jgi:hypothetical protein
MRLKQKNTVPVLAIELTDRPDPAQAFQQRKSLWGIDDFRQSKPENVVSLVKYKPATKKYRVSITFSGEAGAIIADLMIGLEVDSPNDVVLRAIALLVSAQGKEILLRDLKTGALDAVEV